MARGTQERFAKYAKLGRCITLTGLDHATEADTDLQQCGVCGRLLGLHSDAQVFYCKHKQLAERRGSK